MFHRILWLDSRDSRYRNFNLINSPHLQRFHVGREDSKARFLRGTQIAFMIYDYFRVTGAHDTVLDYADLFSITLRNDNVQEFDTRWDVFFLSMNKIPSDDILDSLYKSRIHESDQLDTVLENCTTWKLIRRYRCPFIRS